MMDPNYYSLADVVTDGQISLADVVTDGQFSKNLEKIKALERKIKAQKEKMKAINVKYVLKLRARNLSVDEIAEALKTSLTEVATILDGAVADK
ncbi:MAG: hypothetical protein LBO66_03070 [Deltaproteobacteria bacterium]|nr:hypothetical protein [Deltaproteobacteria bacterium]